MTTQAQFYAAKYAGCWRTARTRKMCRASLCLNYIEPGERYFDTMMRLDAIVTKILCAECANKEIVK